MGQPSDLLASAPVGLRGALRDGLRLRTTVVVAHSSEISSAAGVLGCIKAVCLTHEGVDHPTISEAAFPVQPPGGKDGRLSHRPLRQC